MPFAVSAVRRLYVAFRRLLGLEVMCRFRFNVQMPFTVFAVERLYVAAWRLYVSIRRL